MKTKIRDNQKIKLPTGETITRNLYSEYVSNSNPIWFRYRGEWYLIGNSFEPFEISKASLKRFLKNNFTLSDLIRSYEYDIYQGETVLSLQYRIINETNINEVTHQDIIDNWRNFLDCDILKLSETTKNRIHREIDQCEKRHITAGTIEDVLYDLGESN